MKKIICLLLCLFLILSASILVISATERAGVNEQQINSTGANIITFDANSANWKNSSQVYCHIWACDGTGNWPSWQSKKEKCTDNGDGTWSYDVSKAGNVGSGANWCCIFSADTGMQSYNLLLGSECFGDTAYCDDSICENPSDSIKACQIAKWKGQDATKFGPELTVTSIGNVVGTCCPATTSRYKLMVKFLTDNLENARTYSGKNDQLLISDIAKALGLDINQIEEAIREAGVYVEGFHSSTPDEPATPDEPVHTYKKGDANKDSIVDVLDATCIQKHKARLINTTQIDLTAADANRDGIVDVLDATHIQKWLAHIISEL